LEAIGWTAAFGAEENQAWKAAKDKTKIPSKDDDWSITTSQIPKADISRFGFGDDFAEKLWTTSDPNSASAKASPQPTATSTTTNTSNETSVIPTPLAFTGSRMLRPKQDRIIPNRDKAKDAFDGLGLMTPFVKPAPTLGEARKLRTGLAVMSNPLSPQGDYLRSSTDKPATSSPRPTPSPRQTYLSPMSSHLPSVSPGLSHGNFSASAGTPPSRPILVTSSGIPDGLPIQSRFPSLEELDAQGSSANSLYSFVISDNSKSSLHSSSQPMLARFS
jgi:AP2-associated kinase